MCAHCGCNQPENPHGDSRSVLVSDIKSAMKTAAHRRGGKGKAATGNEIKRMLTKRRK